MDKNTGWLLAAEPWTAYRARIDLLGQSEGDAAVKQARAELLAHPMIDEMIASLSGGAAEPITNHKKAGMRLHKLSFLAEIGLKAHDDPRLREAADELAAYVDEYGVPNMLVNIPKAFGGSGRNERAWSLCDGPLAMYVRAKMGDKEDMRPGAEYLCTRAEDFGWSCISAPKLGKYKGPGKRTDPCPYGTLLMLKLLAQFDDLKESEAAHTGAECLLGLWENSREQRPFMFRMGTDFRKLKAPFVWYDILHVLDVLSQFEWVHRDTRFFEMLKSAADKADDNGRYTPESVWMAYKGFDFAQKKAPSPWISLMVYRISKRLEK